MERGMRMGIFLFLPGRKVNFGKSEVDLEQRPLRHGRIGRRIVRGQSHRCLPLCGKFAAGPVAQWLEPAAHNGLVAGSSPAGPTNKSMAVRTTKERLDFGFKNESISF